MTFVFRRSGDIYQKALGKLCRVYNAAIPLPKTCLFGSNHTKRINEKHCIQVSWEILIVFVEISRYQGIFIDYFVYYCDT